MRDWQSNRFKWAWSDLSGWEGVFLNLLQEEAPASQDFGQGPPSARRTEQCLVSRFFSVFSWYQSNVSDSCPFGLVEVRTQSSNYRLTHLVFFQRKRMNSYVGLFSSLSLFGHYFYQNTYSASLNSIQKKTKKSRWQQLSRSNLSSSVDSADVCSDSKESCHALSVPLLSHKVVQSAFLNWPPTLFSSEILNANESSRIPEGLFCNIFHLTESLVGLFLPARAALYLHI